MQAVDQTTNAGEARIRDLLEEVISGSTVFVVDVEVRGTRGSSVVNVFVDNDEGVGVDDLARISRELEVLLDSEDVIPDRYSLNVSSPGLDRPLSMPRQYKKNVGRPMRVHYRKEDDSGNAEAVGKLVEADEDSIRLEVSDDDVRRIPFVKIIWAKVQLPW
ncbi:MAG: ribosome maturation factor RimP [Rhodothermales bacterium]